MFPSAGKLCPLKELWLPGGFDDLIGVADLVESRRLGGLSDFLYFLGARKLTFADYAERYIPGAFASGNDTPTETKNKLLDILAERIGEIGDDITLKRELAMTNIAECTDGTFRRPKVVYLPNQEVREILENHVSYVSLPEKSEGRAVLYRWLGVAARPRAKDILEVIDKLTTKSPDQKTREGIVKILEAVGRIWLKLRDNDETHYGDLRSKEWLPAEGEPSKWYKPDQLYAAYNKSLFESQAQFLDVPIRIQQQISGFLAYLGVGGSPRPFQVTRHLRKCAQNNEIPPNGIYRWLSENAQPNQLLELRNSTCLHVQGKYLRPDQVFWGSHPFGRFRVQLGPDFQQYQKLLSALDIKQTPDYGDAFKILKDISKEVGNNPVNSEDKNVVFQCWIMLSEALEQDKLGGESIESELRDIKCVPNLRELLYPPSWMFFEDRPGLADKFELLRSNSIPRQERVWTAMEAAGVKPLSDVMRGFVVEAANQQEDEELKERVIERADLIKTISNDTIQLGGICFLRTDRLNVKWRLVAFNKTESTQPEPVSAHLKRSEEAIYFTTQNGSRPWSAIARELTQAIAPRDKVSSVSPGLKVILEASSRDDAIAQLRDLGIALTEELRNSVSAGNVAKSFDEAPSSDQHQALPTPSQSVAMPDGFSDETSEAETHGTAESSLTHREGEASTSEESISEIPDMTASAPILAGAEPSASETRRGGLGHSHDERHATNQPSQDGRGQGPFAQRFFEAQTITPSYASDNPAILPVGGPRTGESARMHTGQSGQFGRSGAPVRKQVARWEPTRAAKGLADIFRSMVQGDYGRRCQICGKTFAMTNGGDSQIYVVHIIPPSADRRTNHFGNLLGLCGWRYALVRYGQWMLLDPEGEPFENWMRLRDVVIDASKEVDDAGNPYISVPVRFWNVYQGLTSAPSTMDEEIRYSIPHWKYLRELLKK